MKYEVVGTQSYGQNEPVVGNDGKPTGATKKVPVLRVTLIPSGDDPQKALQRIETLIYNPTPGDLAKFLPGAELDDVEAEQAAAFQAQVEAAKKAPAGKGKPS